jgi:hypothetical protein
MVPVGKTLLWVLGSWALATTVTPVIARAMGALPVVDVGAIIVAGDVADSADESYRVLKRSGEWALVQVLKRGTYAIGRHTYLAI